MRFFKNIRFDMSHGIFGNTLLFLCPIIIFIATFVDFMAHKCRLERLQVIKPNILSYGDYWMYAFGGMKEYIPSPGNPFQFPIIWVVLFLTISFMLLNYPFQNMQGIGKHILVLSKGRLGWWGSKCVWNVVGTALYFFIIACLGGVLCIVFNIPVSNKINIEFITAVFRMDLLPDKQQLVEIPIHIMLLPVFFAIAINLFQMMLSLFMQRVFSFLCTCVLFISSAYLCRAFMIGNYAMILRLDWIFERGVDYKVGYAIAIGMIVLSIVVGSIRFHYYDIIDKD